MATLKNPHRDSLLPQYATGGAFMRGMALCSMRDGPHDVPDSGYCLDAPECLPAGSTYAHYIFRKPAAACDMRPGSHA